MTRVPDGTFPSSNDWGIPDLLIEQQASILPAPFVPWGSIARKSRMPGTYHFYVDDYKFRGIWKAEKPYQIVRCNCAAVVEVNFSTSEQIPLAYAMGDLYRKRWLSRFWQHHGVQIVVDLNVADALLDTRLLGVAPALLGVPKGWTAYATRYSADGGIEAIERQCAAARKHSEAAISLAVYGGSRSVQECCQRRGWQWFANAAGKSLAAWGAGTFAIQPAPLLKSQGA